MTLGDLVARRLRAELAFQGISQRDLASQIGLSQSAVSARLTGVTDLSVGELIKIAEVLNVPASKFLEASERSS